MGEWQPIETAPPDTDVLLGWWRKWPVRAWEQKVGWAVASNTCPPPWSKWWCDSEATHWMHLPAPPEGRTDGR